MTDDEKKVLIRRYIAAYNNFDVDSMVDQFHPDVVFKSISGGTVNAETFGAGRFRELADQSIALFTSRNQEIRKFDFSGHIATVDIAFKAVAAVDLPGGLKAGELLKLDGRSTFEFKDGRIYRITDSS